MVFTKAFFQMTIDVDLVQMHCLYFVSALMVLVGMRFRVILVDLWVVRCCLQVSSHQKGLKEQGLPLRCPGGLRGAPVVCAQVGPARGLGGVRNSGALFWLAWWPTHGREKGGFLGCAQRGEGWAF